MFSDLGAVVLWQIFYCAKDLVLVVITKLKYREKAMGEQTDKNDVLPAQAGKVEWYDRETGKSALYRQCRKSECIRAADPPLPFLWSIRRMRCLLWKKGLWPNSQNPLYFFTLQWSQSYLYPFSCRAAWAAASLAIGTRNGEQDT